MAILAIAPHVQSFSGPLINIYKSKYIINTVNRCHSSPGCGEAARGARMRPAPGADLHAPRLLNKITSTIALTALTVKNKTHDAPNQEFKSKFTYVCTLIGNYVIQV